MVSNVSAARQSSNISQDDKIFETKYVESLNANLQGCNVGLDPV